jgi:hypothetical protein
MKKLMTLLLFISPLFFSCEKDEDTPPEINIESNSLATDLQNMIIEEDVEALKWCCHQCDCGSSLYFEDEYSFSGDNFVTIGTVTYNLNLITRVTVGTVDHFGTPVRRMVLIGPL